MQETTYWQTYLSAALIGTDRRAPAAPSGEGEIASLLQRLDWSAPESALLSAASAIAQYQAVGQPYGPQPSPPISPAAEITPCPPDSRPYCSPHLSKYLGITLSDYPEAIPELLELIAATRQRIPPKWLPKLLSMGEKRKDFQPLIIAVLGNRGRWLAAQNPNWHYGCVTGVFDTTELKLAPEQQQLTLQQQWETGSKGERRLTFQAWRKLNPTAAREALQQDWKRESWRDREAFITAIAPQLSPEDEPFLEAALTDRAASVRAQAAMLLTQLPQAQFGQRMEKYIQPFIRIRSQNTSTINTSIVIEVTLPKQFNAAWEKDGIVRKPRNGEGEKASWLRQLLIKVPLSAWTVAPEELAKAAATHEWRALLVQGWALAVKQQQTRLEASAWASAWLKQFGIYELDDNVFQDLLLLLPAKEKEAYLRSQLPHTDNDQNLSHWLRFVAQSNQRWDFDFSRLVFAQLVQLLHNKPKYGDLFSPPITLALNLHPGIARETTRTIETLLQTQYFTKPWQKFLERFLGLLTLRWDIYQALANTS